MKEKNINKAQIIAKSVPKFKFYCLICKGKEFGQFKGKWWAHDIRKKIMFWKKLSGISSSISSPQHAYLSSSEKEKRE